MLFWEKNSVSNMFHCYDLKIQVGTLVVAVPMRILVGPPHCVNTFQYNISEPEVQYCSLVQCAA